MIRNVRKGLDRSASLGKAMASEVMVVANNMENPGRLADLAASNLDLGLPDAQELLCLADPLERLRRVNELLHQELDLLVMQQEIDTTAREEMDRAQREPAVRRLLLVQQTDPRQQKVNQACRQENVRISGPEHRRILVGQRGNNQCDRHQASKEPDESLQTPRRVRRNRPANFLQRRLDLLLNCGFGDCHSLLSLRWEISVHALVYPVMLGVIR